MYLYRHIDEYVKKSFNVENRPLTLDEITFKIRDILLEQGKIPVLLRNKTLEKLIEKYEKEHNRKIIEKITNTNEYIISYNSKKNNQFS